MSPQRRLRPDRTGFSLVEVIVALLVFSAGVLAMAAAMGYMITQVRVADVRTERAVAVQRVVERLRAMPFDSLEDRAENEADTLAGYRVWWTIVSQSANRRRIRAYAEGPGYQPGSGWSEAVRDSIVFTIVRGT